MSLERRVFEDADALAGALAARVADALMAEIGRSGAASLAVSGGSTPIRFFAALARESVDWRRVTVTLVDERWIGEESPRSNAGLVRSNLLTGPASAATFVPLYTGDPDPDAGIAVAETRLAGMPRPFAAVVLGMGNDGHTASWFPDGDLIDAATDADCNSRLLPMRAPSAGEPRITMTLPAVLDTHVLALHIEGEAKRAILETALEPGPVGEMPVRAAIRQDRVPLEIYWCP